MNANPMNAPSLRIEIPADASPEELADVCLALLSEPGVSDFVNQSDFVNHGSLFEPTPQSSANPFAFDVAALAASPACCVASSDDLSETSDTPDTSPGFWSATKSLLSKALRIGGPAQLGMSTDEVRIRQAEASATIQGRQDDLVAALSENFDAWDAACSAAQSGGVESGGQLTIDDAFHLQERVWRVIERDARAVIRDAYRGMWMAGRAAAGNFKPLTRDEEMQLEKMYRSQQNYYLNLLKDREMGTGRMDFAQRIRMYGGALRQAFFAGKVLADLSPDVFYRWDLGEAEHCEDCLKLASSGRWSSGVYSARELARMGVWPGSGDTECLTFCKCELPRVPKPSAAPRGAALESIDLIGPSHSSFHGGGRVGREKFARAVDRYEWNHKGKRQLRKKRRA